MGGHRPCLRRNRCMCSSRKTDMADTGPENLSAHQTPAPLADLADDRAQLYDILTRAGLQGRDAHVFTKLVEEMASANLIHRFENKLESKLEAQDAILEARNEALNSRLRFVQRAIGMGAAILAAEVHDDTTQQGSE